MDSVEKISAVLENVPYGLCTCCLVESTGIRPHAYVRSVCIQMRADGKIRTSEIDIAHLLDGRRREKKARCGACGSSYPQDEVFEAKNQSCAPSNRKLTSVPSAIVWTEEHLGDRICKAIAGDSFECADSVWLNAERGKIIRILNRLEGSAGSSDSLSRRISGLREQKLLPAKVANHMQSVLALRNIATYEDRRLDPAETVIARVAADEIRLWASEAKD